MKSILVIILAVVSINAFAWGHSSSGGFRNTSHSYNGRSRY